MPLILFGYRSFNGQVFFDNDAAMHTAVGFLLLFRTLRKGHLICRAAFLIDLLPFEIIQPYSTTALAGVHQGQGVGIAELVECLPAFRALVARIAGGEFRDVEIALGALPENAG